MTLAKINSDGGKVFIPDHLSDEEKAFLLERTDNIGASVARATVEIGLELLKVEQRFRNNKEFGGPKGWYVLWYKSLGISESVKQAMVSAADLSKKHVGMVDVISSLSGEVLKRLREPNTRTNNSSLVVAGASDQLSEYVLNVKQEDDSSGDKKAVYALQRSDVNQVLAAEQLIEEKADIVTKAVEAFNKAPTRSEDSKEYARLHKAKQNAEAALEDAKSRLQRLSAEKAALEAKYEDWRSPEAIKQEFEEAIAKARAEEQAKKESVKEVVKTIVDTSEADKIKAEYEALLQQNNELQAQMQKVQEAKDSWEKMCRAADKKVERMSGATREWENWGWERRMDLINVYITHFAESAGMFNFCQGDVDDAARRALVTPEARFKSHEQRAIQAISMWINVLSVEGVQELKDVLEDRGELPPVDFVDSRELVTIDV
jgi:chemotaxis protein histidine kinase CheA